MTTLRETVMALPADERLEYALYHLEALTGQDGSTAREIGDVMLSPSQADIFAMLKRSEGRLVTTRAIMAMLDMKKADAETTPDMVNAHIFHVRRKLAGQVKIRTVWGHGYILERVA